MPFTTPVGWPQATEEQRAEGARAHSPTLSTHLQRLTEFGWAWMG